MRGKGLLFAAFAVLAVGGACGAAGRRAILAEPLQDSEDLPLSVLNEVEHALARVPSCYPNTAYSFAGRKDSAMERAVALVSAQRADGRWFEGTNDVTYAAVRELEALAEIAPQPVRERIALLENGDLAKNWTVWIRGEGRSDTNRVFTAEGDVLHVSGAAMGGVTTRTAYRDYRLSLEFRFVDNPRQLNKTAARDGGILFHSFGIDGAYSGIWRCSFEYNLIQGASGDLILVGCTNYPGVLRCRGRVDRATRGRSCQHWDPQGEEIALVNYGRIRRPDVDLDWKNLKSQPLSPNERPIGEWNRAEIVCRGDRAAFFFNGLKVGEYWGMNPAGGHVQLQSEGFGIDYRKIVLRPLD